MKRKYIIATSLVACILLYYIEQVLKADYIIKTLAKVILFTVIPLFYIKYVKKSTLMKSLNLKKMDKSQFKLGLIFGALSFFILLIAYYLLNDYMDFGSIVKELQSKSKITPSNFILIGLYITFGNSFLEEFFFRGFIFLELYDLNLKKRAYIYSSLLFSLYHMAIFKTWFNLWLMLLALLGLFTIGIIFNWLNTKSRNFLNSWLVHILADAAIILIGLRLFRMI